MEPETAREMSRWLFALWFAVPGCWLGILFSFIANIRPIVPIIIGAVSFFSLFLMFTR